LRVGKVAEILIRVTKLHERLQPPAQGRRAKTLPLSRTAIWTGARCQARCSAPQPHTNSISQAGARAAPEAAAARVREGLTRPPRFWPKLCRMGPSEVRSRLQARTLPARLLDRAPFGRVGGLVYCLPCRNGRNIIIMSPAAESAAAAHCAPPDRKGPEGVNTPSSVGSVPLGS
jgi:hypothetical protein